jgi:hypothetical protein
LKYYKLKKFPKLHGTFARRTHPLNYSEEEIAEWMFNGMEGEKTPSYLGVVAKWKKSLGPKK